MEVVVVLCRVQTGANVGAVCRVMANCDLVSLRIVGDANIYNETEVLTLALHASGIWKRAEFFPATIEGLQRATNDCNAVFATTRREGAKRKHAGLSPDAFVKLCKEEKYERIALVFGNERTGLTDEEVAVCSHSINIPSSTAYPSYNLSHAVLILAYTLFTHKKELSSSISADTTSNSAALHCVAPIASSTEPCLQQNCLQESSPLIKWKDKSMAKRHPLTYAQSCKVSNEIVTKLKQMGLYKKGGEQDCEGFLSQLLLRSRLSEEEAEYFANIFNKLFYQNGKKH